MTADDADLLRRYADTDEEDAFAELVKRYLPLVYSAALRQLNGDAQHAEDVTQKVFSLLARKAGALTAHYSLAGWLHATTRFAAKDVLRAERRRRAREQEAYIMHQLTNDSDSAANWEQLRPVIDETLSELGERDREAVLLRFFAGLPLADVGARLDITENTARWIDCERRWLVAGFLPPASCSPPRSAIRRSPLYHRIYRQRSSARR